MKITVIGLERSEGISSKTNKPYAIGRVHAAVKMEEVGGAGRMSKGTMGTSYDVDVEAIKRLEHLPLPFDADLEVEDVMRFGKRETKVLDVRPLGVKTLKAAA